MLDYRIPKQSVVFREVHPAATGWEATYVLNMDAIQVKEITTSIEDEFPSGRLFDMAVLGIDLMKLNRELVGGKSRNYIVCDAADRGCASRRTHRVSPNCKKS